MTINSLIQEIALFFFCFFCEQYITGENVVNLFCQYSVSITLMYKRIRQGNGNENGKWKMENGNTKDYLNRFKGVGGGGWGGGGRWIEMDSIPPPCACIKIQKHKKKKKDFQWI